MMNNTKRDHDPEHIFLLHFSGLHPAAFFLNLQKVVLNKSIFRAEPCNAL